MFDNESLQLLVVILALIALSTELFVHTRRF